MADGIERVEAIKQGNPLDTDTMIGAQASNDQLEKILSYIDIGKQEGAKVLTGGERAALEGDLADGYYVQPTVFEGNNSMRVFQEEIFGPVVSLTSFDRRGRRARDRQRHPLRPRRRCLDPRRLAAPTAWAAASRPGASGRTATTTTPRTRPSAATSSSGIGRENHKMMLDHYQQTKNLLVSYSPDALGFF